MPFNMTDAQYRAEIARKLATPGTSFTNLAAAQAYAPDLFKAATTTTAPATTTTIKPVTTTTAQGTVPQLQPNQWAYDPAKALGQAQTYAGLQIDPQVTALTQRLQQAMADAQAQEGRIGAAYSGRTEELGKQKELDKQRALELSIARGAGRSGVVDWSNAQITGAYAGQMGRLGEMQAAEISAVANQLGLTQRQAYDLMSQLEAQRGQLTAAELGRLDEVQWGRTMDMLPWQQLTPAQQLEYNLRYNEQFGQSTPVSNIYGGVASNLAGQLAGVTQQPKTYTEGGVTYTNVGGQIYKDGRLIPESSYQYVPVQVGGTRK